MDTVRAETSIRSRWLQRQNHLYNMTIPEKHGSCGQRGKAQRIMEDNEVEKGISGEKIAEILKRANQILLRYRLKLICEGNEDPTIKLVHKERKQVIKEISAEKHRDLINVIWQLAGLCVDIKV